MDVLPLQDTQTAMVEGIGSTTATFSPSAAKALYLIPIKSPFTPGPAPALTDADIADFTGATPKAYAAAARVPVTNPLTSELVLNFPTPAGGNIFTCTATTNLPQTIYGVYVSSGDDTKLLGAVKFTDPMVLTQSGQRFDIGPVLFPVTNTPLG